MDSKGSNIFAIDDPMPWIIDEVEDKIQTALGTEQFYSLSISCLQCKSWVANEFLDLLTCYDLTENGLDKLTLYEVKEECEPFEEEVLSRLSNMCPYLTHLELRNMRGLSEAGRIQIVSLFRQIIHHNPPIQVLNMEGFSSSEDKVENIG